MEFLFAGIGLIILLLAGDLLVRGAVNVSLRLGVPALIVSLTIVAFGTSAPELLISIKAIHDNAPGLALGNVVGSNTANILLVLGVPALIAGLATGQCNTRKSYITMLLVSVVFVAVCFFGPITWMHGLFLLLILAIVLGDQARDALAHRRSAEDDLEGVDPDMAWWKICLYLALGLIGLPLGADILVDAALIIAKNFGIIGIASLFGKIPVDPAFLRFDLWVMLGASLILAPFVFSKTMNMTKRWGTLFCSLYAAYLVIVVQM